MSNSAKAADLVQALKPEGSPRTTRTSLTRNNQSVQTVLMKKAIEEAGRDFENPGRVQQYWFKEEGMLVLDLSREPGAER